MKNYTKWIVGAVCAVSLTISAFAAEVKTPTLTLQTTTAPAPQWVFALGGTGATGTGDGESAFGVDLTLGRTGVFVLPNEFGLRQSVSYGDSSTTLNTRLYNDWTLFTWKTVDLFGGAAVGLQYGNQSPSWEIAPEAGVRWWVKKDVAIVGRAEVPWALETWEFKDTVRYFLGIQIRF